MPDPAKSAQVRLDSLVAQALQQRAIDSGRSLSSEANVWLRKALGLPPGQPSVAAQRNMLPDPPAVPAPVSVITPPQGRGAMPFRGGWQGPPTNPR